MNTRAFALLTLTTLLFALTTKLPLASAETVLDSDGDPVIAGNKYYIVSSIRGAGGGGLYYGKTGDQTCPVSVLQHRSDLHRGRPVVFQPLVTGNSDITTKDRLKISFADKVECAESSRWVLVDRSYVGIGGSQDHPDQNVQSGEFKIHKKQIGYNFVFYATNANYNLGLKYDNQAGRRRLAVTDASTINFEFRKSEDSYRLSSIV